MQSQIKKSDIKHCREAMTLDIMEDWGSLPGGFAWWPDDADDKGSAGKGWEGEDNYDCEPWYGGGQLGPEPRANGL